MLYKLKNKIKMQSTKILKMDVKPAPRPSLQQRKEGETKKITSTCHLSEEAVLTETLIAGANCNMVFIPHTVYAVIGTQQMD